MEDSRKLKIAQALKAYKKDTNISEKNLALRIGQISSSAVNHILTLRFHSDAKMVSDQMFQRVATFLNLFEDWVLHKRAANFAKVQFMAHEAKTKSESYAISAPPGMCKTAASMDYASNNPNVYYVGCEAHFTKKVFLEKIAKAIGAVVAGDSLSQIVDRIVDRLNTREKPLLIIDEADKLNDVIFQFFITFYNRTINNCGFLFLGSLHFQQRVSKGVKANRLGYAEFKSRIGDFVLLKPLDKETIKGICELNGLHDELHVNEVINTSHNDLRYVKRNIEERRKLNAINEMRSKKLSEMNGSKTIAKEPVHAN